MDAGKPPQSTPPAPGWSRKEHAAGDTNSVTRSSVKMSQLVADMLQADPTFRRDIFLGYECYENARAHWFIFIPSVIIPSIGKVIQVVGNPHTGFGFQIKANCDPVSCGYILTSGTTMTRFVKLGSVSSAMLVDGYVPRLGYAPEIRDKPLEGDVIESVAYDLGLPYRDPHAALPPVGDSIWEKPVPQFERCQEWNRKLVKKLVELGYLEKSAIGALDNATSFGL